MFSSKGGLQTEIWGFIAGSLREKDVHRKINLTIFIEKKIISLHNYSNSSYWQNRDLWKCGEMRYANRRLMVDFLGFPIEEKKENTIIIIIMKPF